MSSKTTNVVQPSAPSEEEKAYLASQQALATKQLEILNGQQDFQKSYLDSIKPLLDQQAAALSQSVAAQSDYLASLKPAMEAQTKALSEGTQQQADYLKSLQPSIEAQTALLKQALDQQTAAINDPVQKEITQKTNDLLLEQLQNQKDLQPLQKQVLQAQLDQILNGNKATPEQAALIDEATQAALASGKSDISQFSQEALDQLRQTLAPSLGLRPSDTPIVDRGQLVAREATRQVGKLESDLQGANANAKLNYPLAASQLSSAVTSSQGQLALATEDFQSQLAQAAAANRLNLIGTGTNSLALGLSGSGVGGAGSAINLAMGGGGLPGGASAINSAMTGGIGLANASRSNPLSFDRGTSTTTTRTPGVMDYLGAAGGLMQGLGAMGIALSDERTKENIQTHHRDAAGRRWVSFSYKGEDPKIRRIGVVAQEVEETDPGAVHTTRLGLKLVNYSKLKRVV